MQCAKDDHYYYPHGGGADANVRRPIDNLKLLSKESQPRVVIGQQWLFLRAEPPSPAVIGSRAIINNLFILFQEDSDLLFYFLSASLLPSINSVSFRHARVPLPEALLVHSKRWPIRISATVLARVFIGWPSCAPC